MKKNLVWFAVFLLVFLVSSVIWQFFLKGDINPWMLLGSAVGIALAYLLISAPKNSFTLIALVLLAAISIPLVFLGLIFPYLNSIWVMIGIYLVTVLTILFLTMKYGSARFFESTLVDERNLLHYTWSGFFSFILINLLIIGALIQPWIPLDQTLLWAAILLLGLLFFLANLIYLEMKN